MSKTVFVGRLPFDYTEEQVGDIFRSAGPITDIRLVFDRETGKSKGFGFVEYYDAESAASAVRNLDNHPVGHLKLKVNYSDDKPSNSGGSGPKSHSQGVQTSPPPPPSSMVRVAELVSGMPLQAKTRFLRDLKAFSQASRAQALDLLQARPTLAYAIVQTLIDTQVITQAQAEALIQDPTAPQASEAPAPQPPKLPTPPKQVPTAPKQLPTGPAAGPASAPKQAPKEEMDMVRQVMALTKEQVAQLPPESRAAVQNLRARVERGEIRL